MAAADHLQVPRQHGLFLHHGIDLGDGTVAHYLEGKEILKSPIEDFRRGGSIKVIVHDHASTKTTTLKRAKSRIGEQRYNLLFNNCEHFANWCKTGKHRCTQMENLLQRGNLADMPISQVLPAALLNYLRLLFKEGISNEKTRKKALNSLKNLRQMRLELYKKLESTLEKVENWIQNNPTTIRTEATSKATHFLLLRGQNLEDQITTLDELETRIYCLLEAPNYSK